jgi:lipopolysaccharide transport system ATP-binding protein
MSKPVISVENLSKSYHLGQIDTGTFSNDLKVWWARVRGKPNPLLRIGETDHSTRVGEELWALKDVSFQVEQGEVLGVIGRNGAGKSTLLKILSRVTTPTAGKINIKGRIASLLEIGTGFHPELTGRENIFLNGAILGMTKSQIKTKFDEIVDFSEVNQFIDTPVKRYSSGMYVRLAFAVAANLESEILLIDEVLAVGDSTFQKKCLGKMGEVSTKEGRTVVFVSHNMEAVLSLCDTTAVIASGKLSSIGPSEISVGKYLNGDLDFSNSINPSILYENNKEVSFDDIELRKVEIKDLSNNPKDLIFTWDSFKLNLLIFSKISIKSSSIIIDIFDYKQQRLCVFDSGLMISIDKGINLISLSIEKFPISAGEYILGFGIGISNSEWIYRNTNLTQFRINSRDVFNIGRPPVSTRMVVAVQHIWEKLR